MLRNVVFKIMSKQYEIYPEPKCIGNDNECKKTAVHCLDVSVPIDLAPEAKIGKIEMECCGEPELVCRECGDKKVCSFLLVQKLCVKMPVKYSFESAVGPEKIQSCKKGGEDQPKP